jgi:hypothetical protein
MLVNEIAQTDLTCDTPSEFATILHLSNRWSCSDEAGHRRW